MAEERSAGAGGLSPDGKLVLLEETASVSTRDVVTGRVRISTHVDTVEEIARASLQSEDVEVTRVAIDKPVVGTPPQMRTEGDLTIIPIFEEVMVVETRLVLKEELHIRTRKATETIEFPVTLHKQRAEIDRSTP